MSGFLCETKLDRRRVVRCPCGGDLRVQLGLSITAQSYLLHQAKGRHCHNLHLTVWPACLHIGPLTSFHRCFSIRSTQQASIIQLRHRKAKVSLSGVTYKAAFFPHIRLGFGSTTTTAVAHIATRLYQHLCSHKPSLGPLIFLTFRLFFCSGSMGGILSAKIRHCSFAGSSEQNQQRRPDGQWNAGLAQTDQSQQLSATALLWAQLGRPKTPSDT